MHINFLFWTRITLLDVLNEADKNLWQEFRCFLVNDYFQVTLKKINENKIILYYILMDTIHSGRKLSIVKIKSLLFNNSTFICYWSFIIKSIEFEIDLYSTLPNIFTTRIFSSNDWNEENKREEIIERWSCFSILVRLIETYLRSIGKKISNLSKENILFIIIHRKDNNGNLHYNWIHISHHISLCIWIRYGTFLSLSLFHFHSYQIDDGCEQKFYRKLHKRFSRSNLRHQQFFILYT